MLRIVYVIRREHQFLFGLILTAVRTRRTSTPSKFCMIKQLTGDLMIGRQCVRYVNLIFQHNPHPTLVQHVSSGQQNIGIRFLEKSWEQLRGIPVDREGEFVYSLRPRIEKYPSRLLCEVKVVDNTKIVSIRSTYKIENLTLYPLDLMLVDDAGHPVYSLEKIVPGNDFSLPIEAVTKNRIRIQPDRKCPIP